MHLLLFEVMYGALEVFGFFLGILESRKKIDLSYSNYLIAFQG